MAQRDGPAVDVDPRCSPAPAPGCSPAHCAANASFISTQIEVARPDAEPSRQLADGEDRRGEELERLDRRLRITSAPLPAACTPALRPRSRRATISAAAPSVMPGAFPAVTVPPSLNAGLRRCEDLDSSCPGAGSRRCQTGSAAPCAVEAAPARSRRLNLPASMAASALLMAGQGEFVLRRPA